MKTSLLAMTTAFALTLGATGASFAQDATATENPTTLEECLVQEGAGATPPGDSIASETSSNDSSNSTTPPAQGLEPALGEAVTCPDVPGGASDSNS
ncbi:hypothetical protein SAMN05216456_3240 [Devosia crocina]|uniref:Uncharacterized protein n=1 Tax=Devosia crocina TaxID=429728 RepID=A0A1I7NTW3_9HYPH|nr:hypothetical protein [Devosia crocina]SFV38062.1 hypothetical protein SAMN05216456_3240 [Devosia crocina]